MSNFLQTGGFSRHEHDGICLYYDSDNISDTARTDLVNLPEITHNLEGFESRSRGRASVWQWTPEWSDKPLFVRQFVHGGIFRHLWGGIFLQDEAMVRELQIALHALGEGIPTARPVALRIQYWMGIVRRAHYVTEAIPGASNLLSFCRNSPEKTGNEDRHIIANAIGRVIAQMHEAGIYHADLNLKNVLILPPQSPHRVAIIDFKKASMNTSINISKGLQNLVRLDRSVLKWPSSRRIVSTTDRLRVLRSYLQSRQGDENEWKRWCRELKPRHWLHYFGRKKD